MGFLGDFFREVVDDATCGAISAVEANRGIRQLQALEDDSQRFNGWYEQHSKSYIALRDALNSGSYKVPRNIFHGNWFTGKAENDGKSWEEEDDENNRRERLIENAIKQQSHGYAVELFRKYLIEVENGILDSYKVFCMFRNEISYLPAYQKEIVDSIYGGEVKKLLTSQKSDVTLTSIKDFVWQIEKHKSVAGRAIVLLLLAKFVYNMEKSCSEEIKHQIEDAIAKAEDVIIDNSCKAYLAEGVADLDAETLLMAGKDFFIEGEPEKAFAYYLGSAKKGNIEAQYRTGLCFERGYGVFKNMCKAIFWYKKSAEGDDPVSKYYLARVYFNLLPENERDYEKAFNLFEYAYRSGVADAADELGNMYKNGNGVAESFTDSFAWYEKGANSGSPWAMFHLYSAYLNGIAVEQSNETAAQWFGRCIKFFEPKMKNSEANSNESLEIDIGIDVAADEVSAGIPDFHGDLLIPGCDSIFDTIASVYYEGNAVVSKDVDRAIIWYEKGATIGAGNSLNWLARIKNDKGWYTDGFRYALRAAESGFPDSMNRVGLGYWKGRGVERDKVVANIWFLRAAKSGNSNGQWNAAEEFLSGETGMPKDVKEARYMMSLAAAQGHEDAKKKLAELDAKDREKQEKELIKLKEELLSKISKLDERIDAAQSQREEEKLLSEKDSLENKVAEIEEAIKLLWRELNEKFEIASGLFRACRLQESLPYLKELSASGYGRANALLYWLYCDGYYQNQQKYSDENLGKEFLKIGHACGDALSSLLYEMFVHGDNTLAAKYLPEIQRLAQEGDDFAEYALGIAAINNVPGCGVVCTAVEHFKRADRNDFYRAAGSVFLRYYKGMDSFEKDINKCSVWADKVARYGHPDKKFDVAYMYMTIENFGCNNEKEREKYYKLAVPLWKSLIELGNKAAATNLGWMCENGRGIERSEDQAFYYYQLAAERGDNVGQCNLAFCYENGKGTLVDVDKAIEWYRKSANQGFQKAKNALSRLGVN